MATDLADPDTIALPRRTATRYVTPLREGGSLPGLVEADDDGLYVVKFRGAGQGPRALVAEWLGNGFSNGERRFTFYPTLAVDVGERATLTVDGEFYHQRGRNYRHLVPATAAAQRGDFSEFPWDLSVSSPDDPYGWTGSNFSPGVRLDLGIDDRTSLHVAGRYTKIDGEINGQGLASLAADGRTANRFQYHEISTWHELQTDTFAATTFRTGRLEHRLVGGMEAGLSKTDSDDVGQIVLALLVAILDRAQRCKKVGCGRDIHAGVDFVNLPLRLAGIFLLDDADRPGTVVAQNPAVAFWLVEHSGEQRQRRLLPAMMLDHRADRGRPDQWHVAAQNQNIAAKVMEYVFGT